MPKVPLLVLGVMIITIGSTAFAINNWDSIIEHGGSIISHIIKALMCLLCFLYKVFPPSMALLYTLWEYFVILALNYIKYITYHTFTAKSLISCLYKVVLTLVQSDFFLVL